MSDDPDFGEFVRRIRSCDQEIATAEEVLKREPRFGEARAVVAEAAGGRAQQLSRKGQHAEAIPDWDRAVQVVPDPASP